ncbi:MAG: hypothetical protein RLN63_05275 [Miltoncostaeaceae bacterium]
MIGRAPAASTLGGNGVGPGTISVLLSAPTVTGAVAVCVGVVLVSGVRLELRSSSRAVRGAGAGT